MMTRALIGLLVVAAAVILGWWWEPIVLAVWFADLLRPAAQWLARRLHGRRRAAGVVTGVFLVALLAPAAILAVALIASADELWSALKAAPPESALSALVSGANPESFGLGDIIELVRRHGASAWSAFSAVAGASASLIVSMFLFLLGLYTFSVNGARVYRWALAELPIARSSIRRLTMAFRETGRGLLVGVGLTAGVQGAVATVAYLALGVPRALVLGFLTAIAALIPSVGTALVWAPVAAGLALTGQHVRAVILAALGLGVISTIDNVLRPVLARFGRLQLPSFVLLVSMLGGLAVAGPRGVILGPLMVRLAKEGLEIARRDRALRA